MRTVIFGGSFNPIHLGHLCVAEEILHALACDRVLFVPAYLPPHKAMEDPGPELRGEMLAASIDDEPRFAVETCELERKGLSYSIDTVRQLVASGVVEERPYLVIGDDLVAGFSSWRSSEALAEAARIVVVHRSYAERITAAFPHVYVDNLLYPISSSLVRSRIASGGAWRFLVPRGARELIERRGLYGLR